MPFHRRRGGSVLKIIISGFILFLFFTALWYKVREFEQQSTNTATNTTSTTTETATTGVTTLTSNGTVTTLTTTASYDNMSLAQLQSLSFSSLSQCASYLDQKWWDTAIQASGKNTITMIPNTAYALPQSYNGWANYFRKNGTYTGLEKYAFDFMTLLAYQVMGTHDMTKAAALVKNYTSYVAAVPVTAADYVSFGGLSALRVGSDTGNLTLAMAQTFPAQVYQLFVLSQDCGYSEQQRATFFGTAMSMSLFVLATSGRDGFAPKWQAFLKQLGLEDAWTGMKGYLKQVLDTSPEAAYHTTMVVSALAKKFPNANVADLASFTSSRIANMVKVLNDRGYSKDEIAQKVADLRKVVDESDDERHVADVADSVSYQVDGFLKVTIASDQTAILYYQGGNRPLTASFLALILPNFKAGETTALKITVHKLWHKLQSYHVYTGGQYVRFRLPTEEVRSGDDVGISFEILPVEDFAGSIGEFTLASPPGVSWIADSVLLKDFKVVDGVLQFRVLQTNRWSSITEFTLQGEIVNYPGVSRDAGIYAEFAIVDYAGRQTNLRLRFDGFSFQAGGLQIIRGVVAQTVSLVSFDGSRLKIVYRSDNRVATMYLQPPSESMYIESTMHAYSGSYLKLVQGKYMNAWQIDNVVVVRDLEKAMLDGSTADKGRVGSELAYLAGDKLGLKNLIIEDPSLGGRDLYTKDNTVAIQARFLKDFTGVDRDAKIQQALFDLADKLQQDYKYQKPYMQDSFAILSYVDTDDTIKMIILEVPKW